MFLSPLKLSDDNFDHFATAFIGKYPKMRSRLYCNSFTSNLYPMADYFLLMGDDTRRIGENLFYAWN